MRWLRQVFWLDRRNLASRYTLRPSGMPEAVELAGDVLDGDVLAGHFDDHAVALGEQDVTGVAGGPGLDAGADEGRLRA